MEKSAREPVTIPTADAAPRTTNLCGNLVPAERSEPSNRLRQSTCFIRSPFLLLRLPKRQAGGFDHGYLGNGSYPCGRHCRLVDPLRNAPRHASFDRRRGGAAVGWWAGGGGFGRA